MSLDYARLLEMKDEYLAQRGSRPEDLEILEALDRGESVLKVAERFYRSPSSIYRLRSRAEDFVERGSTKKSPRKSYEVCIPDPLMPTSDQPLSPVVYNIYALCIVTYLIDHTALYIPRSLLIQLGTSPGRKDYMLKIIEKMKKLRFGACQVYEELYYDNGLHFRFTDLARLLIDLAPASFILQEREP